MLAAVLVFVSCQFCGTRVYIGDHQQPVRFIERDADASTPRSFVIVGGGVLLHQCAFGEELPLRTY